MKTCWIGKHDQNTDDDLVSDSPAAASQPASPPPARRSALEICLFLPSFWRRASFLPAPGNKLLPDARSDDLSPRLCVWSQTRNNLCGSPLASLIPAGSMSTVVWPVGWRWLHHPLPGRVSQAMVRAPRRGPLKRNRVVPSRVGSLNWRHDDVSESKNNPQLKFYLDFWICIWNYNEKEESYW